MEPECKETHSHQGNKIFFILQPHFNLQRTGSGIEDFKKGGIYTKRSFSSPKHLHIGKKIFLGEPLTTHV